jgi:hypothetical protein
MPQYMLLIYNPTTGGPSPEELATHTPLWGKYTQDLIDAGILRAGDRLQDTDVATTVRVRDGETQITDGPFAETKEFLAGYYLVECPDLDTALEHAAKMPNIGYGSIEVRPVWDLSDSMPAPEQVQARA